VSTPTGSSASRLLALDWLRGIAVLVMVECHVFNALLAPQYRSTPWFAALDWLNGFVAPAFLLVSGAVLGLNLQNRWTDVVHFGPAWRRMWKRTGQIFLVAYLLHLPTPLLWQFFGPRGPHLIGLWTKMDILQCVAGSLAILLLLVPFARRPLLHRIVCAVLGVFAAASVPVVALWAERATVPVWLLNYVWPTGIGKFPLVPWAAFPLLGAWLGPAIFSTRSRIHQTVRAAIAGIAFIATSKFMVSTGPYDAMFVAERLGWLLIGLAACCWMGAPLRGTTWILQFGQLSLWSYTVHLIIVYGSAISLGLDTLLPKISTWLVRMLNPHAAAVTGFSPPTAIFWLGAVLFVTAWVVRWRSKHLRKEKI
jgi:uncharacterized membrane protein